MLEETQKYHKAVLADYLRDQKRREAFYEAYKDRYGVPGELERMLRDQLFGDHPQNE